MRLALNALWLILPGGVANMAPVLAARIFPNFTLPVDLGKCWRGRRIFGDHKTIRGMLSGALAGELTFQAQQILVRANPILAEVDWLGPSESPHLLWGAFMGLGALTGDLMKSFFKRRANIPPGSAWVPWDQLDWIVGTVAFSALLHPIPLPVAGTALILGLALHLLIKWLGYLLGINKTRI